MLSYPPDADNWPQPIPRRPGPVDEALSLLKASIEQGATLIGIGPFTNFRLVDKRYAGILKGVPLFLMAGYADEIPPGYPAWKKHDDWNIQTDVASAEYVFAHVFWTRAKVCHGGIPWPLRSGKGISLSAGMHVSAFASMRVQATRVFSVERRLRASGYCTRGSAAGSLR